MCRHKAEKAKSDGGPVRFVPSNKGSAAGLLFDSPPCAEAASSVESAFDWMEGNSARREGLGDAHRLA
eukprot:354426-Chlamydomonas_euryale.AAC.2